ncbi:MAG: YbaB/EbfC family nucleoid-associated protein [SAR324 cluster bacterium]|uniref:Nucleoid-associated protein GYA55_09430 n=1 Tax=SAR324 cluster bacterium TaxID=2024889 RepID=A0A7X9IKN0_9DELT|nr:YbaB/EbfC family nucleoid-associated protein [SAR324 cluster bacterium]
MAKGFPGIPGNMQGLLKQAQKMQEDLKKAQEKAEQLTVEAQAGGGMVRVVVNGKNRVLSLSIEKEVVNPDDIEMLQDLVIAAINEGMAKVQEAQKSEINKITGGISIPGL